MPGWIRLVCFACFVLSGLDSSVWLALSDLSLLVCLDWFVSVSWFCLVCSVWNTPSDLSCPVDFAWLVPPALFRIGTAAWVIFISGQLLYFIVHSYFGST